MANVYRSRKSGYTQRSGVMRRETLWFTAAGFQQTLTAASTAALLGSLNAAALALRPFTVVRARGELLLRSDQNAATEQQSCGYGFAVVSDQASAIGVTAIPTPETDSGSDLWFVYQRCLSSVMFGDGTGFISPGGTPYTVDSKGMRKVEDGQDIVEVMETGVAGTTSGLILSGHVRLLIKLH